MLSKVQLQGHELPVPTEENIVKVDTKSVHAFEFRQASPVEARICLESLVEEPYGISFSEEFMYEIDCVPGIKQVLLTNLEFAQPDGVSKLRGQKALLGLDFGSDIRTLFAQ